MSLISIAISQPRRTIVITVSGKSAFLSLRQFASYFCQELSKFLHACPYCSQIHPLICFCTFISVWPRNGRWCQGQARHSRSLPWCTLLRVCVRACVYVRESVCVCVCVPLTPVCIPVPRCLISRVLSTLFSLLLQTAHI